MLLLHILPAEIVRECKVRERWVHKKQINIPVWNTLCHRPLKDATKDLINCHQFSSKYTTCLEIAYMEGRDYDY